MIDKITELLDDLINNKKIVIIKFCRDDLIFVHKGLLTKCRILQKYMIRNDEGIDSISFASVSFVERHVCGLNISLDIPEISLRIR